jgi:hypothetical protein
MVKASEKLHPLYDVPGTGFRDREDSPMFAQYHKIGWQASWRAEDSEENAQDLLRNPVVLTGLPLGVDVARVLDRLRVRFGAVARIHRPIGRTFAFVAFEEDAKAVAACAVGELAFEATSTGIETTSTGDAPRRKVSAEPSSEPSEGDASAIDSSDPSVACAAFAARIRPARFLIAEVAEWRRDIRAKAEAAREADPNMTLRDPTDPRNIGAGFKRTYPNLLVKPTEA